MSLLFDNPNQRSLNFARKITEYYSEIMPRDTEQQRVLDDITLTLEFLFTAIEFEDPNIFEYYTVWILQYFYYLDKEQGKEPIKKRLVGYYTVSDRILKQELSITEGVLASRYLSNGIRVIDQITLESDRYPKQDNNALRKYDIQFQSEKYAEIKRDYLTALLNNKTREAHKIIQFAREKKIPLADIYQDILQEVMYEVGELWHKNRISIDQEHYCTAVTQTILANFYPLIFNQPLRAYKIVTGTVGTELHEMGARMISDMFSYHGWDSIYLGAGVPNEDMLGAIEKHRPNLVAISITMPQHLQQGKELVQMIKKSYPDMKVAVGGRAFQATDEIWKKWDIDIYTHNAKALVSWAENHIVQGLK